MVALVAPSVPVVASSAAWRDYGVPAAPYFVYVEGGDVEAEESDRIDATGRDRRSRPRAERGTGVDRVLSAARIGPCHPSLYPGR